MAELFEPVAKFYYDTFTCGADSFYLLNNYTYELPAVSLLLYLIFVHGGPPLLRKTGFKWSNMHVQNAWNLFLSVLSVCMFLGVAIPYFFEVRRRGLLEALCDEEHELYGWRDPAVFWVYMFALSKYAELFDTAFLVLAQKPVPFLHWWHHTTVLAFTWFAVYWHFSVGRIFIIVNALIHSFMYYYYYLMGRAKIDPSCKRPTWNMPLTMGQISQMVLGIAACSTWAYKWHNGIPCACYNPEIMMATCVAMYGSYLYLFCEFFYHKYVAAPKQAAKEKKTK